MDDDKNEIDPRTLFPQGLIDLSQMPKMPKHILLEKEKEYSFLPPEENIANELYTTRVGDNIAFLNNQTINVFDGKNISDTIFLGDYVNEAYQDDELVRKELLRHILPFIVSNGFDQKEAESDILKLEPLIHQMKKPGMRHADVVLPSEVNEFINKYGKDKDQKDWIDGWMVTNFHQAGDFNSLRGLTFDKDTFYTVRGGQEILAIKNDDIRNFDLWDQYVRPYVTGITAMDGFLYLAMFPLRHEPCDFFNLAVFNENNELSTHFLNPNKDDEKKKNWPEAVYDFTKTGDTIAARAGRSGAFLLRDGKTVEQIVAPIDGDFAATKDHIYLFKGFDLHGGVMSYDSNKKEWKEIVQCSGITSHVNNGDLLLALTENKNLISVYQGEKLHSGFLPEIRSSTYSQLVGMTKDHVYALIDNEENGRTLNVYRMSLQNM